MTRDEYKRHAAGFERLVNTLRARAGGAAMTRKPSKNPPSDEYKRRVAAYERLINDNGVGHDDWFDPFEDVTTPSRKRSSDEAAHLGKLENEPAERIKPARRPPGPPPTDDWPTWVGRWLILKAKEYPGELKNISGLIKEAREFLEDEKKSSCRKTTSQSARSFWTGCCTCNANSPQTPPSRPSPVE
jgi:hypothetical protein